MKQKARIAGVLPRIIAFIIDMFLIAMPILYFTTYVILDGKESFQNSQIAIFIDWIIIALIQSSFFAKIGASPGYKAQGIYAVNLNGQKASFLHYFLRFFCFAIFFIFGGSFVAFFRKDKRNLHDIITKTIVVSKS